MAIDSKCKLNERNPYSNTPMDVSTASHYYDQHVIIISINVAEFILCLLPWQIINLMSAKEDSPSTQSLLTTNPAPLLSLSSTNGMCFCGWVAQLSKLPQQLRTNHILPMNAPVRQSNKKVIRTQAEMDSRGVDNNISPWALCVNAGSHP